MQANKKPKRSILEIGTTVLNGRYEVIKVIHSSGMANVYLVQDNSLRKQWCMKEIKKSESGKNQVEYYGLLQEANIMKGLSHSNIPRIVLIEKEGDSIFIIMDYVDGMSVKHWLMKSKTGRVPQDIAISWMKQICQVMMYLHNRPNPIFYRDMKPDNVMIQSDGSIKLLDFGISIVIKEEGQKIERALGTKGYAAPEQSKRGNVCDLRSDIYAMGKTMYYMLTGLNPSQIPKEKLKPIREIDSSISMGIDAIVTKCCQENPDDRYQSCEELMYALQNYKIYDTNYRESIRKKAYGVFALFLFSLFLIITSFIPLGMYNGQQVEQYNRLLSVAEQSGKSEDYLSVLETDATKISPYFGYIESVKVDGIFSKEEEQDLLNYLNPNLNELKEYEEYGQLSYEIGKLYWFYYEGSSEDEGMIVSNKWFKDALDLGYETNSSNVYYQLGSFKKNIAVSIIESEDVGMYKEYWGNLIEAKSEASGELVRLQLNVSIASCISTYCYNLKEDSVSYEEVCKQISQLETFISQYTPSIDKAEETFNSLKNTVLTLQEKVDSIYKEGN